MFIHIHNARYTYYPLDNLGRTTGAEARITYDEVQEAVQIPVENRVNLPSEISFKSDSVWSSDAGRIYDMTVYVTLTEVVGVLYLETRTDRKKDPKGLLTEEKYILCKKGYFNYKGASHIDSCSVGLNRNEVKHQAEYSEAVTQALLLPFEERAYLVVTFDVTYNKSIYPTSFRGVFKVGNLKEFKYVNLTWDDINRMTKGE